MISLETIKKRLSNVRETASLEAQVVLAQVLNRPRSWVLAHPEVQLSTSQAETLESCLRRLEAGEPLPYVLGRWEFYGLEFLVSPAALIPRPETELLVEQALAWLGVHPGRRLIADIGTGSGCIAITLASNHPGVKILAGDLTRPALEVAAQNTRRHACSDQVWLVQADLIPASAQTFDLICANLPYIPTQTLQSLPVSRWEPNAALDGGPDGLDLIRRLLHLTPGRLAPGGLLLLEIEARQGGAVQELARQAFPEARIHVLADLAGHDRLARIENLPAR